jgi:hypothetical protein
MEDEYVHNNPQDRVEESFDRLEAQAINISHNMNLLMAALANKLRLFRDDGGSNIEIKSEGKSGDQEDSRKESWKESEK